MFSFCRKKSIKFSKHAVIEAGNDSGVSRQSIIYLEIVIKRWSAAESFSIFENHVHMSKKNLMFAHFFVTFLALNLTAMP